MVEEVASYSKHSASQVLSEGAVAKCPMVMRVREIDKRFCRVCQVYLSQSLFYNASIKNGHHLCRRCVEAKRKRLRASKYYRILHNTKQYERRIYGTAQNVFLLERDVRFLWEIVWKGQSAIGKSTKTMIFKRYTTISARTESRDGDL